MIAFELSPYVFVYGTLKKGFHNNDLLSKYGAKLVGPAKLNHAVMYSLGPYPAIQLDKDFAFGVQGEIWRITSNADVVRLDRLEGHPDYYQRVLVEVESLPLGSIQAWVYTMETLPADVPVVVDGMWREGNDSDV